MVVRAAPIGRQADIYRATKMSAERPTNDRLMAAVDATWPAVELCRAGPWLLRRGAGGGQRVSAASIAGSDLGELRLAENGMRAWGQTPLFQVTPQQSGLDQHLAEAGYSVKDPVAFYVAAVDTLTDKNPETVRVFRIATPLAIVDEIWEQGGIGPARRAVMTRPAGPRITLLSRADDRPTGVAFVAVDGEVAMIHAIEVASAHRRKGCGETLMRAAASFAATHGAAWLALAVTRANAPACALYGKLGMVSAGGYHYRTAPAGPEN